MIRAFICGCAGLSLTADEREFLARAQPWGLILFKRNVADPDQVRSLVASFREIVGRDDAPVLIDQEGGRVQRLAAPHWPAYPAGAAYGVGWQRDPAAAERAAFAGGRLIAADLEALGITVDCAPVLDLPTASVTTAIGNRTFGPDAALVAGIGRAFADGLLAGGVLPVVKHIPGHGRAEVDSHYELPVVTADADVLETDFEPFRRLADLPTAMTAHVIFTAFDTDRPATVSPAVIAHAIRGRIGFDGLLLSDDLSMRALRGGLGERAAASVQAGCDIALHCNGVLAEAEAVAAAVPVLSGAGRRRADAALARRRPAAPLNRAGEMAALAYVSTQVAA